MKTFIALALLLFSSVVSAGQVTLNWTAPTKYTDNVPLPLSAIKEFRVQMGTCGTSGFGLLATKVAGRYARSVTFYSLPPRTYCFRAFVVTTSNLRSVNTKVVRATVR